MTLEDLQCVLPPRGMENNLLFFSPPVSYVRNTPKLRKMPISTAASSELSAICHSQLQITGQE